MRSVKIMSGFRVYFIMSDLLAHALVEVQGRQIVWFFLLTILSGRFARQLTALLRGGKQPGVSVREIRMGSSHLGLLPGVLKLAVVTWCRKESTWQRLSALWSVSRGRIVGVPSSPTERQV